MKTARLAIALLAALTAQLAWAASEDFTVDESTGEGIYTYQLDLPSARGRYQPRLALVNRSGTQKEVNRPCTGVERWDLELFGAPRVLGGMYRDAPHSGRAIAYTSRGAPFPGHPGRGRPLHGHRAIRGLPQRGLLRPSCRPTRSVRTPTGTPRVTR